MISINSSTMKTIGLIGGMSWESTIPYYRLINEGVKRHVGGLHSARLVLVKAAQSLGHVQSRIGGIETSMNFGSQPTPRERPIT